MKMEYEDVVFPAIHPLVLLGNGWDIVEGMPHENPMFGLIRRTSSCDLYAHDELLPMGWDVSYHSDGFISIGQDDHRSSSTRIHLNGADAVDYEAELRERADPGSIVRGTGLKISGTPARVTRTFAHRVPFVPGDGAPYLLAKWAHLVRRVQDGRRESALDAPTVFSENRQQMIDEALRPLLKVTPKLKVALRNAPEYLDLGLAQGILRAVLPEQVGEYRRDALLAHPERVSWNRTVAEASVDFTITERRIEATFLNLKTDQPLRRGHKRLLAFLHETLGVLPGRVMKHAGGAYVHFRLAPDGIELDEDLFNLAAAVSQYARVVRQLKPPVEKLFREFAKSGEERAGVALR